MQLVHISVELVASSFAVLNAWAVTDDDVCCDELFWEGVSTEKKANPGEM